VSLPAWSVSVVSWTGRTITLSTDVGPPSQAELDCLSHLISPLLLHADVYQQWASEIAEKILPQRSRYVVQVRARPKTYLVEINHLQLIRDLVSVIFGEISPRVAVCASETLIRRPRVPDPAVETEVTKQLTEYGFQVVDLPTASESLARENILQALEGEAVHREWVESELKADCILAGEGLAAETAAGGVEVRTEVKCVEVATGRVLGAQAATYSLRTETVEIAAKNALQKATREAMPKIVASMLNGFGKPIHRIKIWRVRNISEVNKIKNALLRKLPRATARVASVDLRAGGTAVLEVSAKTNAADLASVLEDLGQPRIRVTDIACRSISCQLNRTGIYKG
ncbi:MAG: hypothetical protein ACP5R4_14105, partial [Armatimonadota bacterium]